MSPPTNTTTDPEIDPIPPARFALALESLSLASLHAKTAEIRNAQRHLRASNAELEAYLAEEVGRDQGGRNGDGDGDDECGEAVRENEVVIERMEGRVALLKAEVERRGALWVDVDDLGMMDGDGKSQDEQQQQQQQQQRSAVNGAVNGSRLDARQEGHDAERTERGREAATRQSGRLTDQELAARLAERMSQDSGYDDDGDGDDDGVHL